MQSRIIFAALLMTALPFSAWTDVPAIQPNTDLVPPASSAALTKFIRAVVDANPRVQAAYSALNASKAFQSAAERPLYNPALEFGAENADEDTHTVGVSQTIDWGGKRSARTAVASADYLTIEAEYLLTRRTTTIELLSGLSAHQTGLERKALATERVRLLKDFVALAKNRFEAGDIPQVEYNLATLLFADASMKRATVAADLADARQQVNNLTPVYSSTLWPTLDTRLFPLPTQVNTQSVLLALPDVQAAQRRVDSANALVALRKREKRLDPTISLTAGEEDGEGLIGLNLSIPLPVRNSFNYEVTEAYEQYQQAQKIADDVLQRAHARFINASERYQIAQSAWQDWQQFGQISLQQQGNQLRRLWESNELSTTEYLVQISQTIASQDSALDLRQTLWHAWFETLAASGQVDQWLGTGSYSKDANRVDRLVNSNSDHN